MNIKHESKGFSLVELGVSLSIIGMLVAAVVAGANVKSKLELNQIVEDVGNIGKAVKEFKQTYNGYPGDMFDAEDKFGATPTNNGNGDNDMADGSESFLFWQHLNLAGLIEGNYNGTSETMITPITKGIYVASKTTTGNVVISAQKSAGVGLFTTKQAWEIDTKYDDGIPTSGTIIATDGAGETAQDCANTTANPDEFKLSNNTESPCVLNFYIE